MIRDQIASFEDFVIAAQAGNVVALSVALPFDAETPITLASRFRHEDRFFLLESATAGPGQVARYSFIGFGALAEWSWHSKDHAKESSNAIESLDAFLKQFQLATPKSPKSALRKAPDAEKMGGATGWLGYEMARSLEAEALGRDPILPKKLGLPIAFMFLPKIFMIVDQLSRVLTVVHYVQIAPNKDVSRNAPVDLQRIYQNAIRQLEETCNLILAPHVASPLVIVDDPLNFEQFQAELDQKQFEQIAAQCLEDIRAGEIFQIQIGNRLSKQTSADPFHIFRHLRMLNPSPYMFFYKYEGHVILGASPEMMVSVTGDRVVHRPIAGTRRRVWDEAVDAKMKNELIHSEKERAEHVMLVDLARNDIGRIAKPGTVQVEELMTVEQYSHVFHMVSQVCGLKRSDVRTVDVMHAAFPNGTVTGAPKIRAMQLIQKYETCSREFYAGALGVFDFGGNLKSTLLIRTIHCKDGVASTQASAGFVYDSIPAQEWLETRNKMSACLLAMQNTR